jgi:NAD(P)-dependent dehydrogenase (short-subunit alcohol dehydrogenase family)
VLVARTVGGLEAVDDRVKKVGGSATLVPLDMTDYAGLDRLGEALHKRFGKLDVLLGNAAMLGTLAPLGHIEPREFDQVMQLNVTANWRLIRSMDPLLRASDAGRVIFMTSGVSRRVIPFWGTYAISKAALDMMVGIYAAEVADTKVRVNLYNPGATRTGMRASAFPGEDPMTLVTPEMHSEGLIQLAAPSCELHGQWVAGDLAIKPQGATQH